MSLPGPPDVRFKDRTEILDFLLEVASATQETLDLDRILANVATIVTRVIPSQLFAILLYSERRKGLRIRYALGHRKEIVENLLIPLGEGLTGIAGKTRETILSNDVRRDPNYLPALDAVRSELAAPMIARGRLVGVIDLQSTSLNAYSDYDKMLVRLLASRVGISIDNARLYRRVDVAHRTMRTLARVSQEFSSILDLDDLLRKLAEIIRSLINYDAFSILLLDEANQVLRHTFSIRYDEEVNPDAIPLGEGITGAAARTRQPVLIEDTDADPRYIAAHPNIHSEVAVPLLLRDRLIGVLDLESIRLNNFTLEHVRTLTLLAPTIASAIENARLYEEIAQREKRMEDDLQAARKLQTILLPSDPPEVEGLEIGVGLKPAREISGDLFDFFDYDNGQMAIVFGDSSGKGAAAALYAALVGGLLRSLARRKRGPADLLRNLNQSLAERKAQAQYATLLALLWDARTQRLTMANAGGTPPIICRGDELLKPETSGVPVGLLDDRRYEETVVQLQSGDLIVLTSDGIQDAFNAAGVEYGRERLGIAIKEHSRDNVRAIVDSIFEDVQHHVGDAPQFDDQTILILRVQ
jgi:sigma-B regulation protein RsbU (phosphoserine phosphatase)